MIVKHTENNVRTCNHNLQFQQNQYNTVLADKKQIERTKMRTRIAWSTFGKMQIFMKKSQCHLVQKTSCITAYVLPVESRGLRSPWLWFWHFLLIPDVLHFISASSLYPCYSLRDCQRNGLSLKRHKIWLPRKEWFTIEKCYRIRNKWCIKNLTSIIICA